MFYRSNRIAGSFDDDFNIWLLSQIMPITGNIGFALFGGIVNSGAAIEFGGSAQEFKVRTYCSW
jgi:hypothetical protein